jgi:hypothetical protein
MHLLFKLSDKFWSDFEKISNKTYICHLKYGGIWVLPHKNNQHDILSMSTRLKVTLLIATISLESFIPARCCMAPDIPNAMYNSGATTLPVCPTCNELSAYPASTAARDAPTAAPSASARGYIVAANVWAFFKARPPDTTRLATPKSGRSDLARVVFICCVGGSATSTGSRELASASAPSCEAAAGKAVGLTVKNLIGMDDDARTVAIAFPAYIGRVKVVAWEEGSCSTDVTSEMAGASSLAAMRGRSDFAKDEVADTKCVKGDMFESKCSMRGDTVSGSNSEY